MKVSRASHILKIPTASATIQRKTILGQNYNTKTKINTFITLNMLISEIQIKGCIQDNLKMSFSQVK